MKQHLLMICLVVAVGLLAMGCRTAAPEPTLSTLTTSGFVKHWQADINATKDPISQLHLRDDALIAYTRDNSSYWFSASGGQLLAINNVTAPGHTVQPPVALLDRLVIPTTSSLEIFSKAGRRIDSLKSPRALESPAAGSGNSVFVGVSYPESGRLAKIDVGQVAQLDWEVFAPRGMVAAPVVVEDAVFAGGLDGRVWGVTLTRAPLWPALDNYFKTDGPITADLAADDYGVYVASQDGKLYCLDRNTGKIKWMYYAGAPLLDPPVILGNLIIQRVPGSGLVAINKTEGTYVRQPVWIQSQSQQVLSADAGHVYVRSGGNLIVALDRVSGEPRFRSRRTDLRIFATNLNTPMIYAATKGGTVLGIKPVLKPGVVGEIVWDTTAVPESLALAQGQ